MAALDDTTTTEVYVKATTEAAVLLFHSDSGEEGWVPRSLIEGGDDLEEADEEIELEIATFKVVDDLGWE